MASHEEYDPTSTFDEFHDNDDRQDDLETPRTPPRNGSFMANAAVAINADDDDDDDGDNNTARFKGQEEEETAEAEEQQQQQPQEEEQEEEEEEDDDDDQEDDQEDEARRPFTTVSSADQLKYHHIKHAPDEHLHLLRGADERVIKSLLYQESRDKMVNRRVSVSVPGGQAQYMTYMRNTAVGVVKLHRVDRSRPRDALNATFMIEPGMVDSEHTVTFVALGTKPLREFRLTHTGIGNAVTMTNGADKANISQATYPSDASWRVVPPSELAIELGLEEFLPPHDQMDPSLVCFESVSLKGCYLRRMNQSLVLKRRTSNMQFMEHATFQLMKPLRPERPQQ